MQRPRRGAVVRMIAVVIVYAVLAVLGSAAYPGPFHEPFFEGGVGFKRIAIALLSPFWFGLYYHGPGLFLLMSGVCLSLWLIAALRWDARGAVIGFGGLLVWIAGSLGIVSLL